MSGHRCAIAGVGLAALALVACGAPRAPSTPAAARAPTAPPTAAARAVAAPPPRTPAPSPSSPAPPIDLAKLPAGPFPSARAFCQRWLAVKNRDVARIEARCAPDPMAEGCASDCGYASTCTITRPPAGALGPFRSAEIVELFEPCGPGNCLLALGTAEGVWLVDEVAQCSTGEGFSASLTTRGLAAEGDALVWRYAHDYGEPPALDHEQGVVRCRLAAGRPRCEHDP